jgi:hypothetical protein
LILNFYVSKLSKKEMIKVRINILPKEILKVTGVRSIMRK